jgi:hypothetical protein
MDLTPHVPKTCQTSEPMTGSQQERTACAVPH